MHGGQRARARARGGLAVGGGPLHAPVGDEHDVAAGELLLELADEPRLDLLERALQAVGDVEHHGLAAPRVDLGGAGDEEVAEVGLELGVGGLEVEESLEGSFWRF